VGDPKYWNDDAAKVAQRFRLGELAGAAAEVSRSRTMP
jgi:hypothetical protein